MCANFVYLVIDTTCEIAVCAFALQIVEKVLYFRGDVVCGASSVNEYLCGFGSKQETRVFEALVLKGINVETFIEWVSKADELGNSVFLSDVELLYGNPFEPEEMLYEFGGRFRGLLL